MTSGNPAKRSVSYYHGGMPGLAVGTTLLSKSAAAQKGLTAFWDARADGWHSPDHVYFTTDIDLARSFAHALTTPSGRGCLYEIDPAEPISRDPDFRFSTDVFMAPSARIVRVVQQVIQLTPAEETRPFALRQFWAKGAPYVDSDGYVQPSKEMQSAGWTPELLRLLPPWVPRTDLGKELSELARSQTRYVLDASPGIGEVERAEWHKAIGMRDDAINALCIGHYGSVEAVLAARQRIDMRVGPETSTPAASPRASADPEQESSLRRLWHSLRRRDCN